MEDPWTTYAAAVGGFVALVDRLPGATSAAWAAPALGEWDLRALVGHASRSLVTVTTYLAQDAAVEDVPDAAAYLAAVADVDHAAVAGRGRAAGEALGPDPAAAVRTMADEALATVADRRDRLVPTAVGGMLVSRYLETRAFELTVHGYDIAAAAGVPAGTHPTVVRAALDLAARAAVRRGDGDVLLAALTGRGRLPASFSVI